MPNYVTLPNIIRSDEVNGLQFYPSESIFSPTSSAPATSAEYELIFPPTLGGNLISDSEANPFIIIPIFSSSAFNSDNDEELIIRFFTSSHFDNKHTGSFSPKGSGFNVLSVSSSLYHVGTNTNVKYRDTFVNPGTKGSAHAISIRNIVHDLITGSSYHQQQVISASKQGNFTCSIHYTNINRGAQNTPTLFTGSLSSAESFLFITKSTGSGILNFSEPTNRLSADSASLSVGFDLNDPKSIVFQVGTASLGYDGSRANNTLLFFSSSGRVGFGTRVPKANVEISGSVKGTKLVTAPSGSNPKPIIIEDSEIKFYQTSQEDPNHPDYVKDKERARIKAIPGSFNLIFEVSGSEGYTKSVFISQSGRIGFNTDKPQSEFDARVSEAQFQRPGARKGLKINEEGNIESFNKELASAATGSEFVLRYSRGSTVNAEMMEAVTGQSFDSDDSAITFFNNLRVDDQNETLQRAEEQGFNNLPSVGDTIGSIRFVAESGSVLSGEGFNDRTTGEAASIQAVVHSADNTGVRGDLIFKVADQTGTSVQRMVLDAGDEHQLSGSLNIGATDSEFAKLAMYGPEGNLQAGFFRVGASSADLKIGRMLLHDNGTQKVQLSAKGKSFIAGTSGTGTTGTFLGINTQNPTRALQVEGSISCSNNFFLDGEIKRVTNITASGDISASGTGSFTKLLVGGATAFNEGSTQIQANNGVIDAGNTGVFRGQRGKFNIITNRLNGQDIIEFTSANNVNILGPITASNISASGTITANSFVGNLTGQAATVATIAGLAPNTATTQATQPNITSLGTLTTLTVDDITINGSTISDGADLTIDAEGDITLDANGADVVLKDDGTEFGRFKRDSSDFVIKSATNNKDIVFRGVDNSATITALTLDMSEAGKAIFNSDISSSGTIIANKLEADQLVSHVGDANTGLQFASDTVVIEGNDVAIGTFATNRIELNKPITCSSSVSASGTITGLTGSFSALVGDTSQGTSLEVEGPITGSAFRGTKHVLRCETIYINDNPLVQNSVYFGNTLGNQPNNWNDPQAAGGAITSTSTISIAEDDMNWGYILPFDVSKVEVQCSLRPALGNGDDFTLAIYTAARQNDAASANMTITKVANSSGVTFSAAKYVTNDLTYTADLDKGSLIFVGIGSEDATDAKNARGLLNIIVTAR